MQNNILKYFMRFIRMPWQQEHNEILFYNNFYARSDPLKNELYIQRYVIF